MIFSNQIEKISGIACFRKVDPPYYKYLLKLYLSRKLWWEELRCFPHAERVSMISRVAGESMGII